MSESFRSSKFYGDWEVFRPGLVEAVFSSYEAHCDTLGKNAVSPKEFVEWWLEEDLWVFGAISLVVFEPQKRAQFIKEFAEWGSSVDLYDAVVRELS